MLSLRYYVLEEGQVIFKTKLWNRFLHKCKFEFKRRKMEEKPTCHGWLKLNHREEAENCFIYGEQCKRLWVSHKIILDLCSHYMNEKQVNAFGLCQMSVQICLLIEMQILYYRCVPTYGTPGGAFSNKHLVSMSCFSKCQMVK